MSVSAFFPMTLNVSQITPPEGASLATTYASTASAAEQQQQQQPDLLDLCSPIDPLHLTGFLSHGDTIVADVRSEEAFIKAHIQGALPLSLPTVLWRRFLKTRTTPGSLSRHLLSDSLAPLKNISPNALVVLYDEDTVSPHTLPEEAPLRVFAEYLARSKINVVFIEGGFRAAKVPLEGMIVASRFGLSSTVCVIGAPPAPGAAAQENRKRPLPSSELNWIHHFLAVGSERHAQDISLLKSEGVTHILNLTNNPVLPEAQREFNTLHLEMRDTLSENLLSHLQQALEFIQAARTARGRILVHCFAGISRSVSVSVAYFMWADHLSLEASMRLVREHRECASPNLNFIGQLMMFEQTLSRAPSTATSPESPAGAAQPLTAPLSLHTLCADAMQRLSEVVSLRA